MTDNKKTKKSKPTGEATAAKYVLEVLKKAHATSPNKAVEISAFKDLPLSTPTISFTIANFIDQGVIHQTEDNRYWFDVAKWQSMEKSVVRGYAMSLWVPLVLGLLAVIAFKLIFYDCLWIVFFFEGRLPCRNQSRMRMYFFVFYCVLRLPSAAIMDLNVLFNAI